MMKVERCGKTVDLIRYSFADLEILTCSDCPCCQGDGTDAFCGIEIKGLEHNIFKSKPTWCPLKDEGVVE